MINVIGHFRTRTRRYSAQLGQEHGIAFNVRFFFPTGIKCDYLRRQFLITFEHVAKTQPVTTNMGMKCLHGYHYLLFVSFWLKFWLNLWKQYDITSSSSGDEQGPKCIEESQLRLGLFIEEQNQKGNPSHRINLAGFSQGSAMFIFTDLQYPHKLGGALVLSGYLPKREAFQMSQASKDVPILMCHGEMDRVVWFEWGSSL